MTKLLGTKPNQAPTNADLGDLAYQDGANSQIGPITVTGGNVGIGTASPEASLDIVNGGVSMILGADNLATTRTNSANKQARIGVPHYNTAEQNVALALVSNTTSANTITFGGGTSLFNAATTITFNTGANNTTTAGTERLRIDSSGNVGIGTSTPSALLDVDGTTRLGGAVTLAGVVSGGDNEVNRVKFKDISETVVTANSGATYTIDLENGNVFKITLTDNCTFTFSNPPASGNYGSFRLELIQDGTGSRTATMPASVDWPDGTAPTLTTTATTGKDVLFFETTDAGTIWLGYVSGQAFA